MYCWNANVTLTLCNYLGLSDFQWSNNGTVEVGTDLTFTLLITPFTSEIVSQDLCNVTLSLGNSTALSDVIACSTDKILPGQ
jgi:hypothetical protein